MDNKNKQEYEHKHASLEKQINYCFEDKNLLIRALIHKSLSNEQPRECKDQNALSTLGDAVLKTILCDIIIRSGYNSKGEITIKKSMIENRQFLADLGRKFHLSGFILAGKGAIQQKHFEEPNVIAETIEAIIGAMYLDRGFDTTKEIVTRWYEPYKIIH